MTHGLDQLTPTKLVAFCHMRHFGRCQSAPFPKQGLGRSGQCRGSYLGDQIPVISSGTAIAICRAMSRLVLVLLPSAIAGWLAAQILWGASLPAWSSLSVAASATCPGESRSSQEPSLEPWTDTSVMPVDQDWVWPGEFESPAYLLVGWDFDLEAYLLDIIVASYRHVRVVVVMPWDERRDYIQERLREMGVCPDDVELVHTSLSSSWIRDFGPMMVRGLDGQHAIIDTRYAGDDDEDRVPSEVARELWPHLPLISLDLPLDGGNLLADGTGLCVTTFGHELAFGSVDESMASAENANDIDLMKALVRQYLGCHEVVVVPPLWGEPTEHADMFMSFTAPREAIVGEYIGETDLFNGLLLDEVAETLQRHGVLVRRIPMPDNDDGRFRSYVNALAVGDVVLVPVYPERPEHETRALAGFRAAYPDRRIVPIVASDVIGLQGAVHCTTMSIIP